MANFNSPYEYYLDILGSWAGNPALPSLWFVTFYLDSVNALKSNITNFLQNKESSLGSQGWDISNGTINYLTGDRFQYMSNHYMGCVFAKEITMPGERINASNAGVNYSGYQAPLTISNRNEYSTFKAVFQETNASFSDFVLRPWAIATAYNGFVARPENSPKNVKCKLVDIILLSKTGYLRNMAIRKIFRFQNVAPISIGDEAYNHSGAGLQLVNSEFAYDSYTVLEKDTKIFLNA